MPAHSTLLDARAVVGTLRRMADEIVEANDGTDDLVLVGIQRRGVQLAARLVSTIREREGADVAQGALDITLYRDDLQTVGPRPVVGPTHLPWAIDGKRVVIVDDVLYTGRTVRAALDELADFGRPARIMLAVLIDRGGRERPIKKVPALRGATIVNLFFEASTRTRVSFEFAEKRLSADTVNVAAAGSSVQKGETLVDTARNLEAMRIDMVVIRHSASGAARFLAQRIESSVINAGDGTHEHPTQGLLDMLTLRDHFGRLEGLKVCIVGDVLHSRVARSNIWGLTKMGAEVGVCGPRSLLPNAVDELPVTVFNRIEEAIEWADALNVLRLQLERMTGGYIPSLREYNRVFGVTRARLERAGRDVAILHPGPMNRGVEIDSDVADGPCSVILDQVTNGVAVRMAVLYLLSGGRPELAEAAKGAAP